MTTISLLLAAIAPGFSLLLFFYFKDLYHTEPVRIVIRMFVAGLVLVFPTMVVQRGLAPDMSSNEFLFSFFISGALEEYLKWFVIYFIVFKHEEFDEPYDGILYAVAVSLGFATLENILYAFFLDVTLKDMLIRALLPVSGHALFGVAMGFYFGLAKLKGKHNWMWLSLAWLSPLMWHGMYDFILLHFDDNWIVPIVIFMLLLWSISIWKIYYSNRISPFRIISTNGHQRKSKFLSNGQ